jgi:LacI family transcriptional regulator
LSVTIVDIARKAQVSVSTVSRVLNNKPDVNKETAAAVRAAIRDLDYSPSSVARGLVLRRSHIIGYIASDITNPSFPETARGVVVKAKEYGYAVMFFDANHDNRVEKDAIQLLRSKQVDGIILSFSAANRDELERLHNERFPVVQIYRKSSRSVVSTIAIDNIGSGYKATQYLLRCGHRRIAHISTGDLTQSGYERKVGYLQALAEAGITPDRQLVQCGDNSVASGKACMDRLLELDDRPSAVFASHDVMAIGAYEAILDQGLAIPDDISVLGHDNIEISRLIRPHLSTIDTFKYRLGQASVELLMEEMAAQAPLNKEIVCPGELVVRDSVRQL